MQRILVVLLLAFAVSSAFAQTDQLRDFVGTWVDNYGFTHRLCVTSNGARLEGSYSEFGLIQGDLTDQNESVRGFFYATYYQTDNDCPWGEFYWHVNGNKIAGKWVCYDGLSAGIWTLDRVIPQDNPTALQCVILDDNADDDDFQGVWRRGDNDDDEDWNICTDGNQIVASYGEEGELGSTYQFGELYEGGRIAIMSFITIGDSEGTKQVGGSLMAIVRDSTITSFNWFSPNSLANVARASTGSHVTYTEGGKISLGVGDQCANLQDYANGYEDDDDFVRPIRNSSGAGTLALGSIFLMVLFAF